MTLYISNYIALLNICLLVVQVKRMGGKLILISVLKVRYIGIEKNSNPASF